jgi:hypothetical protein
MKYLNFFLGSRKTKRIFVSIYECYCERKRVLHFFRNQNHTTLSVSSYLAF